MARQAVLERTGWRFVRIRGTRFYRAPDETMEWVQSELSKLGIEPSGIEIGSSNGRVDGADFIAWQTHYPTSATPTTAVPEPQSCILFGFALAGFARA